MAEGILLHRLTQRGLEDRLKIDSAGTGGWHAGAPPDVRAIRLCSEHGIDIRGQRTRILRSEDHTRFDLILCADRSTLSCVRSRNVWRARMRRWPRWPLASIAPMHCSIRPW